MPTARVTQTAFSNISSKEPHHSSTKNFLYALTKTKSQYVMLCDQDDIWLPFKVEKTMAKMRELEESLGPICLFWSLPIRLWLMQI